MKRSIDYPEPNLWHIYSQNHCMEYTFTKVYVMTVAYIRWVSTAKAQEVMMSHYQYVICHHHVILMFNKSLVELLFVLKLILCALC